MNRLLLSAGLAAVLLPAKAQSLGPETLTGAVLGGLAGGIIGHNSGGRAGEGIAIGAAAGWLLGAIAGEAGEAASAGASLTPRVCALRAPPPLGRAVEGAVLGGIVGGIIGHNHHRQTAEGVAIGASAGLLLRSLADHSVRHRSTACAGAPPLAHCTPPVPAPPPVPAIPDAPSVPEAPSFGLGQVRSAAPPPEAAPPPVQAVTVSHNYYFVGPAWAGTSTSFEVRHSAR